MISSSLVSHPISPSKCNLSWTKILKLRWICRKHLAHPDMTPQAFFKTVLPFQSMNHGAIFTKTQLCGISFLGRPPSMIFDYWISLPDVFIFLNIFPLLHPLWLTKTSNHFHFFEKWIKNAVFKVTRFGRYFQPFYENNFLPNPQQTWTAKPKFLPRVFATGKIKSLVVCMLRVGKREYASISRIYSKWENILCGISFLRPFSTLSYSVNKIDQSFLRLLSTLLLFPFIQRNVGNLIDFSINGERGKRYIRIHFTIWSKS